jgi:hypothetical protein
VPCIIVCCWCNVYSRELSPEWSVRHTQHLSRVQVQQPLASMHCRCAMYMHRQACGLCKRLFLADVWDPLYALLIRSWLLFADIVVYRIRAYDRWSTYKQKAKFSPCSKKSMDHPSESVRRFSMINVRTIKCFRRVCVTSTACNRGYIIFGHW